MDDQTRRGDVAGDLRGVTQLDALGGDDLAVHPAGDHDLAGADLGLGITIFANRQPALVQLDLAQYTTFDDKVLHSGDVARDGDVLADDAAFGGCHADLSGVWVFQEGALSVLTPLP